MFKKTRELYELFGELGLHYIIAKLLEVECGNISTLVTSCFFLVFIILNLVDSEFPLFSPPLFHANRFSGRIVTVVRVFA